MATSSNNNNNNNDTTNTMLASFASVMVQWLWYGIPISNSSHHNGPFNTFCYDILTATSLSSSVVLLALKYIKTLKSSNPTIKGATGSEYRLFTAALMLANKYLEDSAYTNATFSELSKIPINEINQMEMEFLAVLDYSLYVSETSYLQWLKECEMFLSSQGYAASLPVLRSNTTTTTPHRPVKIPTGARRPSASSLSSSSSSSSSTVTAVPKTNASKLAYVPVATGMSQPVALHYKRPASEVFASQTVPAGPQYKRTSVYGLHTPPSQCPVSLRHHVVIAPVLTYPPTPTSTPLPYASQQPRTSISPVSYDFFASLPAPEISMHSSSIMCNPNLYYYAANTLHPSSINTNFRLQYV